jgi:Uma2 family endonuclease
MAGSAERLGEVTPEYNTAKNDMEDVRYEVIGNVIYMMGGASFIHEAVIMEVGAQIKNYLDGKPCRVFGSNIEYDWTKLLLEKGFISPKDKQQRFLPDMSVLCDQYKNDSVPKMLIEVVSPSSYERDINIKKKVYELIGVEEYWVIIYPHAIHKFVLEGKTYNSQIHPLLKEKNKIPVHSFPGLNITFDKSKLEF